jgi:hypothetical protein
MWIHNSDTLHNHGPDRTLTIHLSQTKLNPTKLAKLRAMMV